jgi:hypothetical protein
MVSYPPMSQRDPTEHVDKFVQKCAGRYPERVSMRYCDKTMTKKADKNQINSMSCHEKSSFVTVPCKARHRSHALWSSSSRDTLASRIFADVRL